MPIVIKTIRTRQYYYEQHSQRVGGKVVTKSKYLGPVNPKRKESILSTVGEFISLNLKSEKHGIDWDAICKQELAKQYAEKGGT